MTHYAWRGLSGRRSRGGNAQLLEITERQRGLIAQLEALSRLAPRTLARPFAKRMVVGGADLHARRLAMLLTRDDAGLDKVLAALQARHDDCEPDADALEPVLNAAEFDSLLHQLGDSSTDPVDSLAGPPPLDANAVLSFAYMLADAAGTSIVERDVVELVALRAGALLAASSDADVGSVIRVLALMLRAYWADDVRDILALSKELAEKPLVGKIVLALRSARVRARQMGLAALDDALLALAWAAGDHTGVRLAGETLGPRMHALAPFDVTPLLVLPDGFVEQNTLAAQRRCLIVIDMPVSPALVASLAEGAQEVTVVVTPRAIRAGLIDLVDTQLAPWANIAQRPLVASFCPPYSDPEEELSRHSAALTSRLLDALARLMQADGYDVPPSVLAEAMSIRVDDAIFAAASATWSVRAAVHEISPDCVTVASADMDFTRALRGLLDADGACPRVLLQGPLDIPPDPDIDDLVRAIKSPPVDRRELAEHLALLYMTGRTVDVRNLSRKGTMLTGRPVDRNYAADMRALGQAFRPYGTVTFLPCTIRVPKGAAIADYLRAEIPPACFDQILLEPLDAASKYRPASAGSPTRALYLAILQELGTALDATEAALLSVCHVALQRLFNRIVPGMIQALGNIEAHLEAVAPERVIGLPGRDWIACAAIMLARRRKIATYDMQTVFIGARSRYKRTPAAMQLAIDSFSLNIFRDFLGVPEKDILIAGSVKYGVARKGILAADGSGLRTCLAPATTIIMFASSPQLQNCQPIVEALVEIARRHPSIAVAIKLHPSSDAQQEVAYEIIARRAGSNALVLPRTGLETAVAAADVVVTRFSNVGFEAALVDKPVVACNFTGEILPAPLEAMGTALPAHTASELESVLLDIAVDGPLCRNLTVTRRLYVERNRHLLVDDLAGSIAQRLLERETTSPARAASKIANSKSATGKPKKARKRKNGQT